MITIDEAIGIMKNEKSCVIKADAGCTRECSTCELVRKTDDILAAYDLSVKALEMLKVR